MIASSLTSVSPQGSFALEIPDLAVQQVDRIGKSRNEITFMETAPGLLEARLERDYQLTLDQSAASLKIENQKLGTQMTILAKDAALVADVGEPLTFGAKTSLAFGEDSKITLLTQSDPGDASSPKISSIVISSDHKGAVITGLGNPAAPLVIDSEKTGYRLDDIHRDGLLLVEKDEGGFSHEYGEALDQDLLDKTLPGGSHGPDKDRLSGQEIWQKVMVSITRSLAFSTMAMTASRISDISRDNDMRDSARTADDRKAYDRLLEQKQLQRQNDLELADIPAG